MDAVAQVVLTLWQQGRRVRKSPSGWYYGNAVCCHHRGERLDKRGRGGIKVTTGAIAYNCFNCGYKIVYKVGDGSLSGKFKKLLTWLGADEKIINTLTLEALKSSGIKAPNVDPETIIQECDLPLGLKPLAECVKEFPAHAEYIRQRGLSVESYPFYVTKLNGDSFYSKRIIMPFMKYGKVIGYTARTIVPTIKPKYFMKMTTPYVFGVDYQQYDWKWAIVTEGPFDALSLDGLAVLHNECSNEQIQIINNLGKKVIVVPHLDQGGLRLENSLIEDAIDNDWCVSIPEWPDGIKDINGAVCEYGPLAVTQMILRNMTDNSAKILLQAKLKLQTIT